jgi:hypothetical protein
MKFVEVEWEASSLICEVVGWLQWGTYVIVVVSLECP